MVFEIGGPLFSQVVWQLNKLLSFLHQHLPHEFGFLWQQAAKPQFLFSNISNIITSEGRTLRQVCRFGVSGTLELRDDAT